MAGAACLAHPQQHGVLVAIHAHFDNILRMAGRFTLDPQFAARARPVGRPARRQRRGQRLGIHPGQHQHLAARRVLCDRRYQSVSIEFRTQFQRFVLGCARQGRRIVGHASLHNARPPGTPAEPQCHWRA